MISSNGRKLENYSWKHELFAKTNYTYKLIGP